MKKEIVLFLAAGLIAILLLGCTSMPPNAHTFELGSSITAKESTDYTSTEGGIHLKVFNFSDSRCPKGVECVWAGERGVDVTLYLDGDPGLMLGTEHLGEITAKKTRTTISPAYEIELVSIDTDSNSATLIVRAVQNA